MSETSSVTRPILEALELLRIPAYRIHCGAVKARGGGHIYLNRKGLPDIGCVLKGRAAFIETKASHKDGCNCKSCVAQREVRGELERGGALYVFARSVAEALRGLGLSGVL